MNKYTKKKPKKKTYTKEEMINFTTIANLLNINIMLRTLYLVEGWRKTRLERFMESYIVLMSEIGEGRTDVNEFNRDTKTLTGINADEILDSVLNQISKKISKEVQ